MISGNTLYVADTNNEFIRTVDVSTGAVTTLAGGFGSADGVGSAAGFALPVGLAISGNNLYVADSWNFTVRTVNVSTGAVTTLAGFANSRGSTDGTGGAARFNFPQDLAISGNTLYVADNGNHTIRSINISTGAVSSLAGLASRSGSDDGTGSAARFTNPYGLAIKGNDLYVADNGNHTIRVINISTGAVTSLAGLAGHSGSDDGTGSAARFTYPKGLAINGNDLYVADSGSRLIRKIDTATGTVTTVLGWADVPYDDRKSPQHLAIANDTLYITTGHGVVQIVPLP